MLMNPGYKVRDKTKLGEPHVSGDPATKSTSSTAKVSAAYKYLLLSPEATPSRGRAVRRHGASASASSCVLCPL